MARLVAARSTDILFPEEGTKSYQSEYLYAPQSVTSHTSSYSREVRCIFESQYSRPKQTCQKPPCDTRNTNILHSRPPRHDNHHRDQTRYRQYQPPPKKQYAISPHQQPRQTQKQVDHNSNLKEDPFASRRRTWSPPTFDKVMGSGTSFQAVRACRSNDQLDNNENIYETLDPPPLAPSGSLHQTSKRGVIKPVAFKPVASPVNRYVSTPQHRRPLPDVRSACHSEPRSTNHSQPRSANHSEPRSANHSEPRSANHSHDDGYASQDYSHVHSGSNLSHNSSGHGDSDRSLSFTADHTRHYKSPVFMSSNISAISSHVDHFMHTPSPSDSGVGELEAMLRDKDAEINQLRETIEVNERAIIQVYEEKIQNLQVEVKEVHDDYEARLRKCQDKGFRTEQALLLQLFNLQQERKNTKSDTELLRSEKEKCVSKVEALEKDNNQLKTRLEEIEWELCQKSGEISLLKSQLKESKDEVGCKSTDMLGLKSKIKDLSESKEEGNRESQRLKQENKVLRADCESAKSENEKLRLELQKVKREMAPVRDVSHSPSSQTESPSEITKIKQQLKSSQEAFNKERDQWHLEKDKVIRYQKQLQLNYVQMCRKNRMLEQEVQQLTLELENRDISLMPDSEAPVEQESVC